MPSVLLITDIPFWEQRMGNHQRLWSLCRYLAGQDFGLQIAFTSVLETPPAVFTEGCLANVPLIRYRTARTRRPRWLRALRKTRLVARSVAQRAGLVGEKKRHVPRLPDFVDADLEAWVASLCRKIRPSAVILEYVHLAHLAEAVRSVEPKLRVLLDAHDVMSDRHATFVADGRADEDWISITLDEEKDALNGVDCVLAMQDDDARRFREILDGPEVLTVTHAPEVDRDAPWEREPKEQTVFLFVGGRGPANLDAVRVLLEEVWPRLPQDIAAITVLQIAGGICDLLQSEQLPSGVELLGRFDALADVYRDADVVLNPVRVGGGLKIKNVEALCLGKALVTTASGAMGLAGGVAQEALWVRKTADEFAVAVGQLTADADGRGELCRRGRRFAESMFTPEAAYCGLQRVLRPEERHPIG